MKYYFVVIDERIPSKFDEDLKRNLLLLCKMDENKWVLKVKNLINKFQPTADLLKKFEPINYDAKADIQYLGIRRTNPAPRPVRIEMVRCSEKYALIAVQNGRSGYILKRGAQDTNVLGEVFHIYAEFKPKEAKVAPVSDTSEQVPIQEGNLTPEALKQLHSTESDEIVVKKDEDLKENITPIEEASPSESHSPTNGETAHSDKATAPPEEVGNGNHTVKENEEVAKEN